MLHHLLTHASRVLLAALSLSGSFLRHSLRSELAHHSQPRTLIACRLLRREFAQAQWILLQPRPKY
ncbi:exported hypothetical protein [Xanthomonas citri pv. citri]|uniref:Uncharacterized protein n=1 Tax=Xanthomonas citri pv. citri TaxID=611301 RepID=A0A0U5F9T5_XANCI|nr:exported hypothetical protein [Xanthomonas citri pv. citri]CEG14292.1 exported hypothetical protein [Xanthomonas citri pv. citri]CEH60713.1 exported hypothetical protein [Xanthomonas citri pv. citri]CEH81977.1 exported hypothetical protein [Xanthomonas citri pv. citri]